MIAAAEGYDKEVERMLIQGADVNTKPEMRHYPLILLYQTTS